MKTLKHLAILFAIIILTTNCKKDVKSWLTETGSSSIDSVNVILNGSVAMEGEPDGSEYGIVFSLTNSNPTLSDSSHKAGNVSKLTDYSCILKALAPGNYSYCSYLKGKDKTQYGEVKTVKVAPQAYILGVPEKISSNQPTINLTISNNLPLTITSDAAWAKPTMPSLKAGYLQTLILNIDSNATQEERIANLTFAGEGFTKSVSFKQNMLEILATLTTTTATAITATTATSGGNVTSDGGATIIARGVCWATTASPTTANSKTDDGTGDGTFTSSLTGLSKTTTYYIRAYATNSKGTAYGTQESFTTNADGIIGSMSDNDGNTYKTVVIGTQVWMAENLRTTKYNDGTVIPNVTDNAAWAALSTPAYCWYNNDSSTNTYGALYNWYTINTGKLAPTGWHVPTDAEWRTLTTYLGGASVAGAKLKETGTTHWIGTYNDATNSSGFTALPGGYRGSDGTFNDFGNNGWWRAADTWGRGMSYDYIGVYMNGGGKEDGLSVRCVRDF